MSATPVKLSGHGSVRKQQPVVATPAQATGDVANPRPDQQQSGNSSEQHVVPAKSGRRRKHNKEGRRNRGKVQEVHDSSDDEGDTIVVQHTRTSGQATNATGDYAPASSTPPQNADYEDDEGETIVVQHIRVPRWSNKAEASTLASATSPHIATDEDTVEDVLEMAKHNGWTRSSKRLKIGLTSLEHSNRVSTVSSIADAATVKKKTKAAAGPRRQAAVEHDEELSYKRAAHKISQPPAALSLADFWNGQPIPTFAQPLVLPRLDLSGIQKDMPMNELTLLIWLRSRTVLPLLRDFKGLAIDDKETRDELFTALDISEKSWKAQAKQIADYLDSPAEVKHLFNKHRSLQLVARYARKICQANIDFLDKHEVDSAAGRLFAVKVVKLAFQDLCRLPSGFFGILLSTDLAATDVRAQLELRYLIPGEKPYDAAREDETFVARAKASVLDEARPGSPEIGMKKSYQDWLVESLGMLRARDEEVARLRRLLGY